jgi:hypothetical protein
MLREPGKPGLQAERTELAWERTAIGFLAIAAVVLFRHDGPLAEGRTGLALVSIVLALLALLIAQLRARQPRVSGAATVVRFVGWSTASLAALIVVFILVTV